MAFLLNGTLKPLITALVNQFVGPYTENIDTDALNANLVSGVGSLSRVRLKKGVFDKFQLPVDVQEGYLGKLTIELPWQSMFNKPVKIHIEDVYILAVPAAGSQVDPKEDEERAQAAKQERLKSAEALQLKVNDPKSGKQDVESQGVLASLITKVINNIQITVKNIHVRYEDKLSNPGHPFAAGITLADFSIVSTDGDWMPAFIASAKEAVHKLASLDSIAIYFDTDAESLAGHTQEETAKKFNELIAHSTAGELPKHQYILKPVSGKGRVTINPHLDGQTPKIDVILNFDEIAVGVDDNQYRDVISMVDMFHFFIRHNQYRKYRDYAEEQASRPKALLQYAGRAILAEVHDKNRRWSWSYLAERRDDRRKYVHLYKKKTVSSLAAGEVAELEALERRLTYEDIRFYRSIVDSQVQKDAAARRQLEERWKREHPERKNTGGGGWTGWLWGSGASGAQGANQPRTIESLSDNERKELYDALEYDEKAYVAASFSTPREAMKLRVVAELNKGLFALRSDPHGRDAEVVSVVFDSFRATFIQRPESFEGKFSLGGFSVYDGTTKDTPYHQIVRVKDEHTRAVSMSEGDPEDDKHANRFFYVKFEQNPEDERADSVLVVKMRHMEIMYHKEFVEAIYNFFKPPESQLESVEALLDAASDTLEGIRRETRAGLEYALQTHKTVDVNIEMQAPIIIIPEDITTTHCRHLLVDAGHISVKSNLADKAVLKQIQQKRKQAYNEADWKNLEEHMYDKFSLQLKAAQFVIGNDLDSSMRALHDESQSMHILERINIDLSLEKSILPSNVNLARMRVSGRLPVLKANFSDAKYKALMRFIDVAVPQLGDSASSAQAPVQEDSRPTFRLPPVFSPGAEYNVELASPDDEEDPDVQDGEEFFEASEGVPADLHQHSFEIKFKVDRLEAAIAKVGRDGAEKALGDVVLQQFDLGFALAKFDMKVDIRLRSLSVDTFTADGKTMSLLTSRDSEANQARDLMTITYKRVQRQSPEFMTTFEGIDQSVDVALSTFLVQAEPEPVITIYNFIMTTFTSNGPAPPGPASTPAPDVEDKGSTLHQAIVLPAPAPAQQQTQQSTDKLFVHVKLDSFQVVLINASTRLATLSLSAADVNVLLNGPTMRVAARLENMSLTDDAQRGQGDNDAQLLSIEGKEVANFVYETFDVSTQPSENSVNSAITFHAGALKFRFVEEPLHGIYAFLIKLARLKGLYDAATQAAVQRASEIEVQRMKFDISVQSPIVIFPWHAREARDVLVVKLGEIGATNRFEANENRIKATLRGIQVASTLYYKEEPSTLKIVDDVEIVADVVQPLRVDRSQDVVMPDTRVAVKLSDIRLALTQTQYQLLMSLLQSIPRVFAADGASEASVPSTPVAPPPVPEKTSSTSEADLIDLQPEIVPSSSASRSVWPSVEVDLAIGAVKLHLYDANATDAASLKSSGIARFALNNNAVRLKMMSNGGMEVEVVLKSFTMGNTYPGASRFREVIPAAQHERNQFMVLYSTAGGQDGAALVVLTVDSPQIIFAVDPLFALLNFFTNTGDQAVSPASNVEDDVTAAAAPSQPSKSTLDIRADLHDVSISVLESDSDSETQAIQLSIKQVSFSQQTGLTASIKQLGMSLTRMNHPSERVSFLDDLDITLAMESRSAAQQQLASIEVNVEPIVFRASYRDINLIQSIVNKAIALSTSGEAGKPQSARPTSTKKPSSRRISTQLSKRALAPTRFSSARDAPQLLMTKEQLAANFKGFTLILIGDTHEMPIVNLSTKPFIASAKDWSGELHAATTISASIQYWNLTNSHWEPLIEPWTFSALVSKDSADGAMHVTLSSRDRLDINVSSTGVELALAQARALMTQETRVLKSARGSDAPYKILNRTGCRVRVWTEGENVNAIGLADGEESDWRFDDWRTVREHVSTVGRSHSIGILIDGKPWEAISNVRVDREIETCYALRTKNDRSKGDAQATRLLCEVTVVNNVKVVTLRSTYKIENKTLFPVEVAVGIDAQPYMTHKLAPGKEYALPLDAVTHTVRLRPDPGFGYAFSGAIHWESLVRTPVQTITCLHDSVVRNRNAQGDGKEPPFNFHAWAQYDVNDPVARKYPKMTLKLHIPVELENLLPFDLDYRVFDKHSRHEWGTFLRKGGIMPVTSVQLNHLVLLNVKIQDPGFKASDFAIINTDNASDFEVEKRLPVQDSQGRKLDLRINYMRHPDAGGAFRVQVYSPYIVVNKTGLSFAVRATRVAGGGKEVAGDSGAAESTANAKPILLSHPLDKGNEFSFRVGNSSWSKYINFEAPSADAGVCIPSSTNRSSEYNIGISWAEGVGKYKLSKVITLAPRFIFKNMLDEPVCFREHGVAPQDRNVLQPGQRTPIVTFRPEEEPLLTFAYPGLNAKWSSPINVENIGSVHIRMTPQGDRSEQHLLRADVLLEGATIFIVLHRETGRWPFTVENISQYPLKFAQVDEDRQLSLEDWRNPRSPFAYTLQPKSAMDYAWDFPASPDKKLALFIGDRVREVDILEIGNLPPFEFPWKEFRGRGRPAVSVDVRADGKRQVLTVSDFVEEKSLYRRRTASTAGTLSRQDTFTSLGVDAYEVKTQALESAPSLVFKLDFDGVGLSLLNKRLVEVVYLTMQGIRVEYTLSQSAQGIVFSCENIQIDNQLQEGLYPVVLQPTPLPRNNGPIRSPPVVQVSLIVLNDNEHGVTFVKYASVLLQAISVQLDEDFLFAVYDLTKLKGVSWEEEQESVLILNAGDIPEPSGAPVEGQDIYFEVLELQPIQLSVSFMRTDRVNADEKISTNNPLAVVLNALTMAVGNINDATLRMNALAIKDMRLTVPELQTRIIYHYKQEVLRQLYRVLFSADFIGNPVGLFTNVSSGVKDVFYEPILGVVHGNTDLGVGIAKGAASFVKKTVFGLSDTFTKFTGSVGKGIAAATLDADYQDRRRLNQRRNKPRHAIYGVAAGAEAFASSFKSGAEGLVMKPIEGAETGGAFGFFKGVGQGLVGAVTKPVVGVFDLASNVGEGIRNTTTVFDKPSRDRARYPRLIPADGILTSYNPREALGQFWLRDLEHGKYKRELYVAHIDQPDDTVVLLTTTRLLAFSSRRLRLAWDLPFAYVKAVNIEPSGIMFKHKEGDYRSQFVHCAKESTRDWFFKQVARVVRDHNARKHVDK